jgi:hypothetical protein
MYGIYANIWGILMVNVTIYSIHGSYSYAKLPRGESTIKTLNIKAAPRHRVVLFSSFEILAPEFLAVHTKY